MKSKIIQLLGFAFLCIVGSCTKSDPNQQQISPPLIGREVPDSIGSQTDTIAYINKSPNASEILNFNNYRNNTENIHPKVLYFEKGWRGYKFWMAYTPYPNGESEFENPCIAVSNDGINWSTPIGFNTNPLDFSFENGYNSDTHLVYREDLDIIECWYRPYKYKERKAGLFRRTSHDGINWAPRETMIDFNGIQMLSPAVNFENGKYKIWYCYDGEVRYIESKDSSGKSWPEKFQVIEFDWSKFYAWHMDVIKSGTEYEMIVCAWDKTVPGTNNNTADLFYCATNLNNKVIKNPFPILKRNTDKQAFDYRSIYRASFIKLYGKYYVYYSAIANNWKRSMALSFGRNIEDLHGYASKKPKSN